MVDIVVSVAAKVAEYLVAPVGRQCGYVIFTNSYVGQLREELKTLDGVKDGVQRSVNDAENQMMEIRLEVNRWKNDAENSADKARGVLGNDGRANETCFCGWLPNPKERYCLGRDAWKTAQAIQKLNQDGRFETVCYERDPPGHVPGASDVNLSAADGGDTITDSRASIFQDIMKALDDENQKVIGVYGPGGVGKTTLLEEVEKKLKKEGRPFHMIVKAKVSQTPDLNKIQDDIFYFFGLKGERGEEGRRDLLRQRLQKDPSKKVLIILDDLWKDFDLREVGIPSGDESKGCKLLLTSRFKYVLEQMGCGNSIFLLKGLKDDEAFRLFEKTVGDKLKDDEELKAIAPEVVKKLAGLPLLIISVARSLQDKEVAAWRIALKEIDPLKMETIVKLNYDHLKSEDTKTLFLLCGLIGGTIEVELLFVLAMGLGLFERFNQTMQEIRDRLNYALNELRSACLLLDGGNDKDKVTIHDLYSEMVVSTPLRDHNCLMMNSSYWSSWKEKLEKCWAICLDNVGKDRLAELMMCQFPNLKILMLSQPNHLDWMLRRRHDMADCSVLLDFTFMKKLQVLYVCSIHIARLPSSIGILGNLHSLYLDYCDVDDVAILGELKALQILSLAGSALPRLPKEIGDLTNLRSLNLSNCDRLRTIEPGVLERLINLEELYLRSSFDQWMGKDGMLSESCNARLAELKSLTKIASLEISIPDPFALSEDDDFPFGNLIKFWINIGKAEEMIVGGLRTMELKLEEWDIILSKKWVQKILQKTKLLYLDGLNTPESIANRPSIESIANSSNGEVEVLADDTVELHKGAPIQVSLPHLESLMVRFLSLEEILSSESSLKYNNLKLLHIEGSKSTSSIPKDWILKLPNLESMEIVRCQSTEVVFDLEELKVTGNAEILSRLTELILFDLPKLQCMCKQDVQLQGISIFRNLEKLYISNTGLSFLFPVFVAKCLREIREIEVMDCPNMTAMIVDEGGRGDEIDDIIKFPLLKRLFMRGCPRVKFFSYPHGKKKSVTTNSDSQDANSDSFFVQKVSLPSLDTLDLNRCFEMRESLKWIWHSDLPRSSICELATVRISNCLKLLNVFPSTIIGKLQNLKEVVIEKCDFLESLFDCGSLDANIEQPTISLPKLERMKIKDASELRCIVKADSQMILGFPSLKEVSVVNCSELRYLFPNFTATTLEKLERIRINGCNQMKEVVLEKGGGQSKANVMSFPSLRDLSIWNCLNLGAFIRSPTSAKRPLGEKAEENNEWSQPFFNEMVTFPNIRSICFGGLQCKELWDNQIPANSFSILKSLGLRDCNNLQCVAPSHIWKRLQLCLEDLKVVSCRSIEIIYEGDGMDTKGGELRWLYLRDLENLRHIWQSDRLPNILFPNLREIEVVGCSRLETLFPTFTAKFLGQIEELVVESCENMELIADHEKGEEGICMTITFSKLTLLRLFKLPKFKSFLSEKYSLKFPCSEDLKHFPSLQAWSIESCGAEPNHVLVDWEKHYLKRLERKLPRYQDPRFQWWLLR